MIDLATRRQVFAEELEACANLRMPALLDAFATVPRERFLPEGPWLFRGEADLFGGPRHTSDGDPRHLYHNVAVAIDPSRQLFNGAPGVIGMWIEALAPTAGSRVLHIGAGLGYYTAILAHCAGSTGRVVALEVDADLAARARENLDGYSWVEVRESNGTDIADETFDAVLVNAGVTHPLPAWLDALAPAGRVVVPLTCTMPQMGPIGKGLSVLVSSTANPERFTVRLLAPVAIYSAVGVRDAAINEQLGRAFMRGAMPRVKTLRRDRHAPAAECWLHMEHCCLSAEG